MKTGAKISRSLGPPDTYFQDHALLENPLVQRAEPIYHHFLAARRVRTNLLREAGI
jgi:hypothetical protein